MLPFRTLLGELNATWAARVREEGHNPKFRGVSDLVIGLTFVGYTLLMFYQETN